MNAMVLAQWFSLTVLSMLATGAMAEKPITLLLMDRPPLTMNDPHRKGIVGDITVEALRRAGYQAKIEVQPAKRAMINAKDGKGLLIIPLARIPEREPNYTWIAPAIEVKRAFYALDTPPASFEAARTVYQSIAVERGTAAVSLLRDNGFSDKQIVEVNHGESAPRMLLAGRVDAWYNWVAESEVLLPTVDPQGRIKSGLPVGTTTNYIACSLDCDRAVVAGIRSAVDAMSKDGTIAKIAKRYQSGVNGIHLTIGEYPPYFSANLPGNGVLSRLVTSAFAREGLKVTYEFGQWSDALAKVESGASDGSAGWTRTDQREKTLLFSNPFFVARDAVLFLKKNPVAFTKIEDMTGMRVGVLKGMTYGPDVDEAIRRAAFTVTLSENSSENIRNLLQGRVNAILINRSIAEAILEAMPKKERAQLQISRVDVNAKPWSLTVGRSHPNAARIIKAFDAGLEKIKKDGSTSRIVGDLGRN